jgi:hypothetical protein
MESAFPSRDLWKDPCTTFVRMDGVLLEVHNRKEECRIWSLIATTSHIIALKLTASRRLIIESFFPRVQYSLDFHKYCLCIIHSQLSVLLGSRLTSSHTMEILQHFTILLYRCSCIAYFEWVPYIASVHSQTMRSWSQPCARISLLL